LIENHESSCGCIKCNMARGYRLMWEIELDESHAYQTIEDEAMNIGFI
jgi:AmiR/NasT family two-component response regulator